MGWRDSGLIGVPVRRMRSSQSIGPSPSSGVPAPSMMRPSKLRADGDRSRAGARHDAGIRLQAVDVAGRHEIQTIAREADDFRLDARAVVAEHVAAIADGRLATRRFERQPDHASQHALDGRRRHALDARVRGVRAVLAIVGATRRVRASRALFAEDCGS